MHVEHLLNMIHIPTISSMHMTCLLIQTNIPTKSQRAYELRSAQECIYRWMDGPTDTWMIAIFPETFGRGMKSVHVKELSMLLFI